MNRQQQDKTGKPKNDRRPVWYRHADLMQRIKDETASFEDIQFAVEIEKNLWVQDNRLSAYSEKKREKLRDAWFEMQHRRAEAGITLGPLDSLRDTFLFYSRARVGMAYNRDLLAGLDPITGRSISSYTCSTPTTEPSNPLQPVVNPNEAERVRETFARHLNG